MLSEVLPEKQTFIANKAVQTNCSSEILSVFSVLSV
jgi:hypothetical protein